MESGTPDPDDFHTVNAHAGLPCAGGEEAAQLAAARRSFDGRPSFISAATTAATTKASAPASIGASIEATLAASIGAAGIVLHGRGRVRN